MLFKRIVLSISMIGVGGTAIAATPLPPNSIDLANYASSLNNGMISPVIASSPMDLQPQIVPSTMSMVQQQVDEYQQSQLTPQQLMAIKDIELKKARVTASPYNNNPNPIVRTLAVTLNPGETPPIIRVSKNLLTTIVFTDNDGNAWEIEKVALNRNQFSDSASKPMNTESSAQPSTNQTSAGQTSNNGASSNDQAGTGYTGESLDRTPKKGTNILTIEPLEAIAYGNMSVTLKGKTMPIIFLLTAGQPDVDIRVDARIPGRSPDAPYKVGSFNNPTPDIDNNALAFLDGTIPSDAVSLIANDPAAQAWEYGNSLYVKTRLDVLYPNYHSRASTPDGINIYRFDSQTLNSVTLMQRQGQPVTVTFEESPYSQYEK